MDSAPIEIRGALNPVYCNSDGVCGAVLGMGKVASSSSMQAILLNPQLDFSQAYYILSGVGGVPPSRGTIGEVVWATWLVDYDLGHRWAADEVKPGEPLFMPRKGYESIRVYRLKSQPCGLGDAAERSTRRSRIPRRPTPTACDIRRMPRGARRSSQREPI